MSITFRIFAFDDDGRVRKLPATFFDELPREKQKATPEYSGKRIRMVLAAIELENRKPSRLVRADYMRVGFDKEGFIDQKERNDSVFLSMERVDWENMLGNPQPKDILEQLRPSLANIKYNDKYAWKPNPVEKRIVEAVALL